MTPARKRDHWQLASLGDLGAARLRELCKALRRTDAEEREALALFQLLSEPWGQLPVSEAPAWPNDLTDDGTPFEFSVGFEGEKPELRMLFESQCVTGDLDQHSSWQAGLALQRVLSQQKLIDTSTFDSIAPLFAPRSKRAPRFTLWHAAVIRERETPLFKAYLNPQVDGTTDDVALVEQAFERLGMRDCWPFLAERFARQPATRVPYISLDLTDFSHGRVKVYLTASDVQQVEGLLAGTSNSAPDQAGGWLRALTGRETFASRPVLVCLGFRAGKERPEATVHVPVRSYVPNDEEALGRAVPYLTERNAAELRRAMSVMTSQPLHKTSGILTYVSLRPVGGHVRVTTYLAPCAYSVAGQNGERGSGTVRAC